VQLKLTFATIALAAVIGAACQQGPEMPTAQQPEVQGAPTGEAARGGSPNRGLTPAAITLQVVESGLVTLTQDGVGTSSTTGTATLVKTAGTTARRCFLASSTFFFHSLASGEVTINGSGVTYTQTVSNGLIGGFNYFAEVTSLVKPTFDAAPVGNVNFTIGQPPGRFINGHALSCVLNDPSQPTTNTVLIFFGHQNNTGDSFQVTHPIPVDPTGLVFDMSLGIAHSQQCCVAQVSIVDVNSQRLTSCAGHLDDTDGTRLVTVGGTGDSNANPVPTCTAPPPAADDELYNLVPFVSAGETTTTIFSQNPSLDDTIFYVSFFLNRAVLVGTECGDGVDNDGDGLIDFPADPGCTSAADATESPNPPPTGGLCPAPPTGGNVITGREFLGVVVFVGTEGDDVAVGLPDRRNIFLMRGGNDHANGANLQDSFFGGLGDDTWCGDAGTDVAFGGQGSDTLTGLDGTDRNDGGHTPVPSSSNDVDTDTCFGEFNFLCEQSFPDGVVISSARFKQDVSYLLPDRATLFGLRPAVFRYRSPYGDPAIQHLGLIAEDVDLTHPGAVVRDERGRPSGVRYRVLSAEVATTLSRQLGESVRSRIVALSGSID
jgi:hypothetical protein